MNEALYKEIIVWRQENEKTLYRYRGFQNLKTREYYFFHCDHIHHHDYDNTEVQMHQEFAFRQNLFAGGLNNFGDEMFKSIEEAIADLEGD